MPWHVVANHDECPGDTPWAVIKDDDGSVAGCHASRADAESQLAALYAKEKDMSVVEELGGKPNPGTPKDKRLEENRDEDCPKGQRKLPNGRCVPDGDASLATEEPELHGPFKRWSGVLAVEGVETGDGREFAPGSLEWGDPDDALILLQWQIESKPQHEDSVTVGRIDRIERDGHLIRGWGVIDLGSPNGAEVARLMRNKLAGGVSVDVDSVKDADVELVFAQPADDDVAEDSDIVTLFGPPPEKVIFHRGRIRAATLVALPAFVEANLRLDDDDSVEEDVIITAQDTEVELAVDDNLLASGVAPLYPSRSWFTDPKLSGPTPWTVTDEGHVYGHLALWSTCHTTFPDRCVTPPRERDFPYFMRRELKTEEGDFVGVGPITMGTGHASLRVGAVPAAAHYDDTGLAAVDVAVGEDRYGIWVAGALRPTLDELRLRELRGASLSGDWRRIGNRLRLVAVLAVNVPGYPIPRMRANAQIEENEWNSMVAAGIVTPTRAAKVRRTLAEEDADGTIRVRRLPRRRKRKNDVSTVATTSGTTNDTVIVFDND